MSIDWTAVSAIATGIAASVTAWMAITTKKVASAGGKNFTNKVPLKRGSITKMVSGQSASSKITMAQTTPIVAKTT
ncbi:MAG: hypothetical protein JVY19_10395 [Ferrovum myxofaciens]|uniref:hypothetical protein n=1 Tax=Ferrovum myxofaciens TaxID=416213 RepID=UPI001C75CEE0|nr:hypothetical protein [Ferrovum myxofaciens]QWY74217.1 MAG: hypothetical protein JVY19_10395 [Ferrovum myxofaciens]